MKLNPRILGLFLALIGVAGVAFLLSCEKPPEPAPTSRPSKPMVIVIPGLGNPQTGDVVLRLKEAFGNSINVVNFGTGRNSYLNDIGKYATDNPHSKLVLIGHSYGTDKINQKWAGVGEVSLAILLDPVPQQLFGEYTVPSNVHRVVVITGDYSGLFRAKINGPHDEFKVHQEHSAMAHDPQTLSLVESAVREALQ